MYSARRILIASLTLMLTLALLPVLNSASASASTLSGQSAGYSPGWKILWGSDAELARDLDGMVATGAKWIRIDFDWPSIQPNQSSWYWHATDRAVREATKRGLQVLALPTYTPSWQRPAGTTDKHAPRDPAAYAAFVKAAAERYAPLGVRHWEIWNEANIVNFWQPTPDPVAYTRLLKAAAPAIRGVDPGATIITSGTAPAADTADRKYVHPTTFLRTIYAEGGKSSFDAVAHHPYSFPVNPLYQHKDNAFWGVTPALRDIMVSNGDSAKKLWGTEFGAPTGTNSRAVSEQVQADHLVESYNAWSSWSWTGPLFWYNWRNTGYDASDVEQNFGLITDDFRAKPALAAMTKLFAGGSTTTTTAPKATTTTAAPTTTTAAPTTTTAAPTTTTAAPTTTTTAPTTTTTTVAPTSTTTAPSATDERAAPTRKVPAGQLKRLARRTVGALGTAGQATLTGTVRGAERVCPRGQVLSRGFHDIDGSEHAVAVDCAAWWGITSGLSATSFGPRGTVSRAQMASFLIRLVRDAAELPLPGSPPDAFTDDEGSVHEDAIDQLHALGILRGRADGTFGPGDPVTRAAMVTFLARTHELLAGTPLESGPDRFADDDGSVHEQRIGSLAAVGVAAGTSATTFQPGAPVRREQMATFLVRLLDLLVDTIDVSES